MKLERTGYGLLVLFASTVAAFNTIFMLKELISLQGSMQFIYSLQQIVLYLFFYAILMASLASFNPRTADAGLTRVAVLAVVFAVAAMIVDRNMVDYSILAIASGLLATFAGSFPQPLSGVIRAAGLGIAAIATLALATYASGLPAPLLVPNLSLYGAIIALMAGYIASLFMPQIFRYVYLATILVLGIIGLVTGSNALYSLPPALATGGLDAIETVSGYLAAITLIALGITSMVYATSHLIPGKEKTQEEQERRVEIEPASDETKTR